MLKSGLETGSHHAIFWVLEVKDQKYYKNYTKESVFVYILRFIFYGVSGAKTNLQ